MHLLLNLLISLVISKSAFLKLEATIISSASKTPKSACPSRIFLRQSSLNCKKDKAKVIKCKYQYWSIKNIGTYICMHTQASLKNAALLQPGQC
jgi:hypothetical protein